MSSTQAVVPLGSSILIYIIIIIYVVAGIWLLSVLKSDCSYGLLDNLFYFCVFYDVPWAVSQIQAFNK